MKKNEKRELLFDLKCSNHAFFSHLLLSGHTVTVDVWQSCWQAVADLQIQRLQQSYYYFCVSGMHMAYVIPVFSPTSS